MIAPSALLFIARNGSKNLIVILLPHLRSCPIDEHKYLVQIKVLVRLVGNNLVSIGLITTQEVARYAGEVESLCFNFMMVCQ